MTAGSLGSTLRDYAHTFRSAGPFLDAPESWSGIVRPFARADADVLPLILDDLAAGSEVWMDRGALLHSGNCARAHRPVAYMDRLGRVTDSTFSLRVIAWPAPMHPKVISLYPEISDRACPGHPHLFRQQPIRRFPEFPVVVPDALCTYRPGDGEWSWKGGTLGQLLDYAALYVAKHVVWQRTGGANKGLWIGAQASHEPQDHIRDMDPRGECRCGSGRRYGECCLRLDKFRVEGLASFRAGYGGARRAAGMHRPAA
jgi:hypothetical protein